MVGNVQNIFMKHDLNILMIFCIQLKRYNFDPYNVLLVIATNIAVLLMTASVLQGHVCNILQMNLILKSKTKLFFCSVTAAYCIFVAVDGVSVVLSSSSPETVDHQLLLLLPHADAEQRADLAQRRQQVDGVVDGGGADGVGLPHGSEQLSDAVVLSSQQTEHQPNQLWILDVCLLSPAHHRLRDQLLQIRFTHTHTHTHTREELMHSFSAIKCMCISDARMS